MSAGSPGLAGATTVTTPYDPTVAPDYTDPATQSPALAAYTPDIVSYGGKASDEAARLTSATWDDYVKRFQPESDALIASTGLMNPGIYKSQVQAGVGQVNKAYDSALGTQATSLSRFGMTQTGDQQSYNQTQDNVNRSASVVDSANRIRQRIAARDQNIVMGGTGTTTTT